MKKQSIMYYLLGLGSICIFMLSACGTYEEGYEDGRADRGKISFSSDVYNEAYEKAQQDVYYYEEGRKHGAAGVEPHPELKSQLFYRKGYRDAGGLWH